jgi:hypothetical protein
MKKVLSVFLAALMVFSFMAVTVSATEGTEGDASTTTPAPTTPYHGAGKANSNQAVFCYDLNGGSAKTGLTIYDESTGWAMYHEAKDIPQVFYIVPTDISEGSTMFTVNRPVTLPSVTPPQGYSFVGWQRVVEGEGEHGGSYTTMMGSYTVKKEDAGTVVQFVAIYEPAAVEEDTFSKVFEILSKIFGAILGVITGRGTDAGIATMKNLFGSLMN